MTVKSNQVKSENDFLPIGYTVPDKARQFMKLKNGDNIIRILSTPVLGWVVFTEENKAVRKIYENGNNNFSKDELAEIKAKKGEDNKIQAPKHFWMMLAWDYATNSPKILEITQVSILKKINAYLSDEDWGDIRDYNLNITRSGTGKTDTEYDVIAKPKKELPTEVSEFLKEAKEKSLVNLNSIWDGEYPFEIYNW